ncbi:MAG TPA: TetR/AcrR family transcriptional regulator [Cytophagaceae bacterium]
MEPKFRILKGAEELVLRYGVRSITMDDIARHLAISKKTIYQFFKDKNEMVCEVVKHYLKENQECFQLILGQSQDPIDEVLKLSEHVKVSFQNMNPGVLFEIKKYHPAAYKLFQDYKEECIYSQLLQNLKYGIEKGLYRKEMNVEVIAKLRIEEIVMAFDPFVFPHERYNLQEVQLQLIDHYLYGICTLKGHKLINKYKQIREEE